MGKPERKRLIGRPRIKCQNNIKMDVSRNIMRTLTYLALQVADPLDHGGATFRFHNVTEISQMFV
jgi:hypothetical protein